ncbi:MAG TPA: carboxypeptidase-like regulatory domain-containing protein [Candidatus Tumulicola sp.]|jgi:hypothetical protein
MKSLCRSLLAALVLVAGAAACNSDALPPAAGFTTIAGTVVDAGNKPVSGAIVTIDTLLTATTDANGKFSIDKVPSGIVDYTVQAEGYPALSSTTSVEPGKPFELDVTLAAQAGH